MKLSLYWQYETPVKLMERLSSKDVALWQAYDLLFPFGQAHTDRLIARLIAVVYNLWTTKETPSITADDVLGVFRPLTEEYVTATLRSFTHGTN